MADILVVDDDETIVTAFRQFLADEGHDCRVASSAEDAMRAVEEARPHMVIMDVRMPGFDGLEALDRIRQIAPGLSVIIMTAYGTSQTSIEAMRLGAFDYLNKPLDLDDLRSVIRKALDAQQVSAHVGPPDGVDESALVNLVGKSEQMVEVYKLIGVLASNDVAPLIVGERGVGKQLVAQTIHLSSRRKDQPFVVVDCRAFPEHLQEAELFGREGSPGGVVGPSAAPGKLESAQGGTVLLADIDALSLPLQARLERVLSEKRFQRAAGSAWIRADARIVAAAEREIGDLVRQGSFSRELYQALGVIVLRLPPLRARREDIPELVSHFIGRFNAELTRAIKGVDDRVMRMLMDHPWSGNVAELEVVIKRACILSRGEVITPDDIGNSLEDTHVPGRQEAEGALQVATRAALHQRLIDGQPDPQSSRFHEIVGLVEETLVREALNVTGGNQVKAAEILGVNRATLRKKMLPEG